MTPPPNDDGAGRLADLLRALREHGEGTPEEREALVERHEHAGDPRPGQDGATQQVAGRTLGPFVLRREIGRGGMGVVYEAHDPTLARAVAVKVLPAHLTLRRSVVDRFHREAGAVARLRHEAIVTIHRVDREGDTHFFAMELVPGPALADVIVVLRSEGRTAEAFYGALGGKAPSPPPRFLDLAVDLIATVADALHHAHENGVIHRDVKPSNILLRGDGAPVLTDFGLAQVDDGEVLTLTGDFTGTPSYISPEQALAQRVTLDRRTDVFSLGVTLYELLTLERAFDGKTTEHVLQMIIAKEPRDPQRLCPDIPDDLAAIVLKTLEKDRDRRYATAKDLADDLRAFRAHLPVRARRASAARRVARFVRREPLKAALGIVLALGVPALTGLGGFLLAKRDAISVGEREIEFERRERLLAAAWLSGVGRSELGMPDIDAALASSPLDAELLAAKGWLLTRDKLKSAKDGIAWLDTLGPPAESRILRWLRVAFLRADGNGERARELSQALGAPQTGFEWFLHGLATAYVLPTSKQRLARSLESFERAILESPRPRRLFYLAIAQFGLMAGEAERVTPFVEAATRLWPDNVQVWTYTAWVHGETDPDLGERDLRHALTLAPDDVDLNSTLARHLVEHGDAAAAEAQLRHTLRIAPGDAGANQSLCRLLAKRRDAKALGAALAAWIEGARSDHHSSQVLAEYLQEDSLPERLRNPEAALAAAERAVELSRHRDASCLWTLANLRAKADRSEEALALALEARNLHDGAPNEQRDALRMQFIRALRERIATAASRPTTATEASTRR